MNVYESPCPCSVDFIFQRRSSIGTQAGGFALVERGVKVGYDQSWDFKLDFNSEEGKPEGLA